MPLLPVSASRTSAVLSTQRLLHQLNADQLSIQRQLDQLSSGRRVMRASDDPAAAGRAIGLQRGIDHSRQMVRNAESTAKLYQSTDSALARVDDALITARATVVQAAQSIPSDDERESMAFTLRQNLDSVIAAGNSLFRDQPLLGGSLDQGSIVGWKGGQVVFQGLDATGRTKLAAGEPVAINIGGQAALGIRSVIQSGRVLEAGLSPAARLADLRGGEGVRPGVVRISDGSQWQTVDLSRAATIGDVALILESLDLGGRSLAVTIGTDSFQVTYADGLPGTLAIADMGGDRMARDLGVANPQGFDPPPLIGDGLAPVTTTSTRLADLDGGAGIDLSAGLRISQGNQVFEVDLSAAETLGDVVTRINRSEADVVAELDRDDGRLLIRALRSGVDYSIGENGGLAATRLGIRSATGSSELAELSRGRGVTLHPDADDLVIVRPDGVELGLDLANAGTVGDVMELIENHPLNQDANRVVVSLVDVGNGLRLDAPSGAQPLRVRQPVRSDAGRALGWIASGQAEAEATSDGGTDTLIGIDFLPREPSDVFDTLIRLERAIRDADFDEIERLQGRLDVDFDRANRARGRVGIWSQNLEQLRTVAEDDRIALQTQLSDEIDADLATVISDLTNRQVALEASLKLIGRSAQLTVLNFL